ncbi:chlorophyllase [Arthrobacter frigidicola]|nr:chlorophyllase [Arthrobacter frigidicola]
MTDLLSPHADQAVDAPVPVMSVSPVVLPVRGRGDDLQVRVSAPVTGRGLPVILFSHGNGSSMRDYGPLVDHWAAHGFAVIQPTHLDSRTLDLSPQDPRFSERWRFRVNDLQQILDQLDSIEAVVPGLAGRLDHSRIAAAGHSWGGHTVGQLLGARVIGQDGGAGADLSDPRISAGVLLAAPGRGGADLTEFAAANYPFLNQSFTDMTTPALVVAGDRDRTPLSVRGADWCADPYRLSPGRKSLLTVFGAEHSLGGIPGYGAAETTDENPTRVAFIQQATFSYLRSALYPTDPSWSESAAALDENPAPLGRIDSK